MSRKIPEPATLSTHGPARVLAMVNQKGGVGKTTSTVSLGAALAGYGRKVLLVDFDPQGALSISFGLNPNEMELSIYNLLTQPDCHVGDVIVSTNTENLDLLPSNIDLSAAEIQLVSEVGREYALGRALEPIIGEYDVILIDTPSAQPSSDAHVIAQRAGAAIVVGRKGRTRSSEIGQLASIMTHSGIRILGTTLNEL